MRREEGPGLRLVHMTMLIGIIANPASGKDIRRLVAQGSVFDTSEKINILRRVLRCNDRRRGRESPTSCADPIGERKPDAHPSLASLTYEEFVRDPRFSDPFAEPPR